MSGMVLAVLRKDPRTLLTDSCRLAPMSLLRVDDVDGTVAVLMDVPFHEGRLPLIHPFLAGQVTGGLVGPVFVCSEYRP